MAIGLYKPWKSWTFVTLITTVFPLVSKVITLITTVSCLVTKVFTLLTTVVPLVTVTMVYPRLKGIPENQWLATVLYERVWP